MDKLLKIGTGILGILAVVACLSTAGIVGYALVGGEPEKSSEEVYQAEAQAYNEEMQDIQVLNEATPVPLETPTPLYNEHIHNYIESMDIKANCYREGRLKYTCDTCGDVYYIDTLMTGHRPYDEWTVTREATPDLVGLRVKYCIYCDQIVAIEDIPYTSEENGVDDENHIHNYTSIIEREPTCVLAGLRRYTCSCGSSYTEPIHASGHVASDWEVAAEATTTHKGTEQRMCRVCGVLLDSRSIDAKRESPSPTQSPANTATPTETPRQSSVPTSTNTPVPTSVPTTVTSPKEESREIYRDENVVISYTGITGDEDYYDVNFIIENLSSRTIEVQVRETSINGAMVNPICSIEVAPGKRAFDDMAILGKDATNVPKSRVTNIETKFYVFDWNDSDFGYETENVVILPYNATNTQNPTVKPIIVPTATPTTTATPTMRPTITPTAKPTNTPTARPTNTPTARPTNTPTATPTPTPDERIYGLGDTWKVDGQWELTFDKVTVTEERNNYSIKNPKQVLIIDYTYKNIGYENDMLNGLFFSFAVGSQIVDSTGLVGYDYTIEGLNSPKSAPIGASCKAQDSLGLDNKSSEVKIIMSEYDGNEVKQSATFVLPISEGTATPTPTNAPEQGTNVVVLEESSYTIYDNSTIYNIIIKNNGEDTVRIEGTGLAVDANKDILAMGKDTWNALAPGHTGCLSFWLHDFKKEDIPELKYELDISNTDCIDMSDFISYNVSETESGIIIECVNESNEKIYSASPHCMFYNNGMNVYYDYSGLHSPNPNENFFEELKCNDNNTYDSYKIFIDAWNLE